jgi:hypothetical protein
MRNLGEGAEDGAEEQNGHDGYEEAAVVRELHESCSSGCGYFSALGVTGIIFTRFAIKLGWKPG